MKHIKDFHTKLPAVFLFLIFLFITINVFVWSETAVAAINTQDNCIPGRGWSWKTQPTSENIAPEVEDQLRQLGYSAEVTAREFGESDSCGNFEKYAVDFSVTMAQTRQLQANQNNLAQDIYDVLHPYRGPELGIIQVDFPAQDKQMRLVYDVNMQAPQLLDTQSLDYQENLPGMSLPSPNAITATPATETFNLNVYVIVYDPIMSTGELLSERMNWNDHAAITQGTIDFFSQASNNRVNYTVAETYHVDDWADWPIKTDGFQYTEAEYLDVMSGQSPAHSPDSVNYNTIVNNPAFGLCEKFNNGEIDEVWIYNGPYFGFYESTLAGPNGYWFNSNPVPGPYTCNELMPIMGPSPERTVTEAVHNFGHRTESTMKKTYGSWNQNNISHGWNKFGLVDFQSPLYDYSGCGSIHYPPNGQSDYDYHNSANFADTNCDDFVNYSDLTEPMPLISVNCSAWQCGSLQFLDYWFSHLPSNNACDTDDISNDWWKYFADPDLPVNPTAPCLTPPPTPTPSATPNAPVSIGNQVWYDANNNGLQDDGEPTISGVVVNLYDPGADGDVGGGDDAFVQTSTTAADGSYAFTNILADSYYLLFEIPPGYSATTSKVGSDDALDSDVAADGGTAVFSLIAGESNNNLDAGLADSQLDYGDLPSNYNRTILGNDGPRHLVGTMRLGANIDTDPEGQESSDATADAFDDGVIPGAVDPTDGSRAELFINLQGNTVSGSADVGVWIDWNNDGSFSVDDFYAFPGLTVGNVSTVEITVPANPSRVLNVRVRAFDPASLPGGSLDVTDYAGFALNGEVEDYQWSDGTTAVTLQTFSVAGNEATGLVVVFVGLLLVVGSIMLIRQKNQNQVIYWRLEIQSIFSLSAQFPNGRFSQTVDAASPAVYTPQL